MIMEAVADRPKETTITILSTLPATVYAAKISVLPAMCPMIVGNTEAPRPQVVSLNTTSPP